MFKTIIGNTELYKLWNDFKFLTGFFPVIILEAISGSQHLEEKPTGYCFIQMYMKNSYSYYGRSFISHTVFTKVFCLLQLLCKLWLMVPSSISFWGTLSQMCFFCFFELYQSASTFISIPTNWKRWCTWASFILGIEGGQWNLKTNF